MTRSKLILFSVITLLCSISLKAQNEQEYPIGKLAETPELTELLNHPYIWNDNEYTTFNDILVSPRFNNDIINAPFVISNVNQLVLLKDLLDILPSHSAIQNTFKYNFNPGDVYGINPCMFLNPTNNHRIEDKFSVNYKIGPLSAVAGPGGGWPPAVFDINLKNICNNTLDPVMYVSTQKTFGFGTNQPAATYHFAVPDFQIGNSTKLMLKMVGTTNNESLTLSKNGYDLFKVNKDGKVFAREFEVTLVSTFPDYVFGSGYHLMGLQELEQYITENKHLPGIAPAAAYEAKGTVDMGELQLKMLEKIEELTLYVIEQQKKIEQLERCLEESGK